MVQTLKFPSFLPFAIMEGGGSVKLSRHRHEQLLRLSHNSPLSTWSMPPGHGPDMLMVDKDRDKRTPTGD